VTATGPSEKNAFNVRAAEAEEIPRVRELFREYAASLNFDLCFQSFEEELAALPGAYAEERQGALLVAERDGRLLGCVALRRLREVGARGSICEMKRLYVAPEARGSGAGDALLTAVIAAARRLGYAHMRLDTVPGVMDRAITMYRRAGFREIAPYNSAPLPEVLYLELEL
jgi:N-acetylglutamate synthase-like GNAT family acetyltransferase